MVVLLSCIHNSMEVFRSNWKDPEADLPATAAAVLSLDDAEKKCQVAAKKRNAIAFANLTTAHTHPV